MSNDPLVVQVSIAIKAPKRAKISKRVLQQILDLMIAGKPLPKNVRVRGIFWRNPARRGSLGHWRWHSGADMTIAPSPLEAHPREPNWEATIPSLSPYLEIGSFNL